MFSPVLTTNTPEDTGEWHHLERFWVLLQPFTDMHLRISQRSAFDNLHTRMDLL